MLRTIFKIRVLAAAIPLLFFTSCKLGFLGVNSDVTSSQVGSASYVAGPAMQLGLDGVSSWASGKCSPVFTVTGIDSNGAPSASFPQGTLVGITGIESDTVYLDPACSIPEPSRLIPVVGNSNRAEFYLKPTVNGPKILTATIDGMPSTSAMVMIQSGSPTKISLAFPATINANQCTAGSIGLFDDAGNTTKAAYDITSNLTLSVNNGTAIYSDASCDNVITSATIPANMEQKVIYTFAPTATPFTVTNSGGTQLTGSQKTINVLAANMPKLFVRGPANLTAGVCTPYQIETYTAANTVYRVRIDTPVNLTGSLSSSKFFSDAQCTGTLANNITTIPAFASVQTFYVLVTQAEQNLTVETSSGGYAASNVTNPVVANIPKQIVFSGVPASIPAGRCSNAILASLKDQYGNTAKAAAALKLAPSYTGEMLSFHPTADCGGAGLAEITINNNESSTTLYFKARNPGASTFQASANGLTPATSGTVVIKNTLDVPNLVKISGLVTNPVAVAGECLELRLKSFDANNYPLDVYPNDIAFALSSNSTNASAFFTDSNCSNGISSLVLAKETNQSVFYYKITKTEAQPILISAVSTTPALTATASIATAASSPAQLEIASNLTAITAATCNNLNIVAKDRFGNPTVPANDLRILLEGGEFVHFFKDSNCSDEGRELTLSGTNSANFYFKVDSLGNNAMTNLVTIVGLGPVGVAAASKTLSVLPPSAIHVAITGDNEFAAGSCTLFSATSLDSNNNPLVREPIVVALSAQGANGKIFFSNSSCTSDPVAYFSVTINSSQNPAKFWVKSTVAGDISISTNTGGTGTSSTNITVKPKPATALNFVANSGSSTFMQGDCAGPYVVESRDEFGNLSPVASDILLSANFNPAISGNLYQDSGCSVAGAQMAKDSASATFYLKLGGFGDIRISIAGAPLTTSGRSFTILNPATVVFTVAGVPLTSHSFGDVELGAVSNQLEVNITNSSASQTLEVAALTVAAPFQKMGGNCPTGAFTLPVQGTCKQFIAFAPTVLGSFATDFTVSFTSGAPDKKLFLTGTGIPPHAATLTFSPNSIDFGTTLIGTTYQRNVTLKNVGTRPASNFTFANGTDIHFDDVINCPATLAPNEECTLKAVLSPTAEGNFSQSLPVNYQDGTVNKTVSLSGIAVVKRPAELFFTVNSLNFGSVLSGSSKTLGIQIENRGLLAASAISIVSLGAFSVESTSCGGSLSPGAACGALIRFAPVGSADFAGEVSLTYSSEGFAGAPITKTLPLMGTGFKRAALSFSPSAMTFPNTLIGSFRTLPVRLRNDGDVAAENIQVVHTASSHFSIDNSNCPGTLAKGASCTVNLSFAPVAGIDYRDSFKLSYLDSVGPILSDEFSMTGKGVTPAALSVNPSSLDFGGVVVEDIVKKTFVVKNAGLDTAVMLSVAANPVGSLYQIDSNNCGTTVLPGAECAVVIAFSPTVQGSSQQNFNFSFRSELSSPNSAPRVVTASALGNGVAGSNLTISTNAVSFGTVLEGTLAARTISIANDSSGPITSISVVVPGAPFSRSGGTCPANPFSLSSGTSCNVMIELDGTTPGSISSNLRISYSNGARIVDKLVPISAVVGTAGRLSFPAPTYSIGPVAVESQKSLDVLIVNSGDFEAQVTSFASPVAPFSIVLQGCGAVAPKANCIATVTFKPAAAGNYQIPFSFDYRDTINGRTGSSSTTINAEAFVAGSLVGDITSIPFVGTIVGGKAMARITISHRGDGSTNDITNLIQPLGSEFSIVQSSCVGKTLTPGKSCVIDLSFEPKSVGPKSAQLTIGYQNSLGGSSFSIPMNAIALSPAKLVLDSDVIDMGSVAVGAKLLKKFKITNLGQDPARNIIFSQVPASDLYTFASDCGASPFSLAPNASCEYQVTYEPKVPGFSRIAIQLSYQSQQSVSPDPTSSVAGEVRGVGVVAATLQISQTLIDFGDPVRGTTPYPTRRVTLKNSGAIAFNNVRLRNLEVPFSIQPVSCPVFPATLAAGQSCEFDIVMDTRTAGRYSGNFYIDYHNTVASQTLGPVPITGFIGIVGELTISDSLLNFSSAYLGATAGVKVVVKNTGDYEMEIPSVVSLAAPYSFNLFECAPRIKPRSSCNVMFNITPTVLGAQPTNQVYVVYRSLATGTIIGRIPFTLAGTAISSSSLIPSFTAHNFGTSLTNGPAKSVSLQFKAVGTNPIRNIKVTLQSASTAIRINGNVCSTLAQLAVGSTCEVSLGFLPTDAGLKSATLSYTYTNEVTAETDVKTINLSGFAAAPAKLVVVENPTDLGYVAVGGFSTPKRVKIINTGGDSAKISMIAALDPAFRIKTVGCPATPFTLEVGHSCEYEVSLYPTQLKTYEAKFTTVYSSMLGSTNLAAETNLRGSGIAPSTLILPQTLVDFGMPSQGEMATQSFVLSNTSNLDITGVTILPMVTPFGYELGNCGSAMPFTIKANSQCAIQIKLSTTAYGTFSSSFSIRYMNGVTTLQTGAIALKAKVGRPGRLVVLPASYNFISTALGALQSVSLELENAGDYPVNIVSVPYILGAFSLEVRGCTTIDPQTKCAFKVGFAPQAAVTSTTTFSFVTKDYLGNSGSATLQLSGTGLPPGTLVPISSIGTFGSQPQNYPASNFAVYFRNDGASNAVITSINFSPSSSEISYNLTYPANACRVGAVVVPGGACGINVVYTPRVIGNHSATLSLSYSNNLTNPTTASITVTGSTMNAGMWYPVNGAACSNYCSSIRKVVALSQEGSNCASGENVPPSAAATIKFGRCWPDYTNLANGYCLAHGGVNSLSIGAYCYTPSQKRDNDATDITKACFCR